MRYTLYIVCLCMTMHACQAQFFRQHHQGWHWYQDPPIEEQTRPEKPPATSQKKPKARTATPTPTEVMEAYKQQLADRFAKAWLNPTPEHVMAYQTMQKQMVDRSTVFSDVWMRNIYQHPQMDHTLTHPVNQRARHIHLDREKQQIRHTIQGLSQEYGLFFFFSGKCSFCHAFAPIVKQFSTQYGWEVLAISVDGGKLEAFDNAVPDQGLVNTWGVQTLPALFAVNPRTEHVIPIAYGLISLEDMETRIMMLAKPRGQS